MTKVYLIRHTSVDVPPGTCYGQTDVPVKDTFPQEAAVSKARIEGLHFDKVFTSPLTRCVQLATFCGYPDAERRKEIMELNFGKWEMVRYDELHGEYADKWYADYFHTPAPEGESFVDQFQRVSRFLEELKASNYENVLVFAHGGVLACSLLYCGRVDSSDLFSHMPQYGEMITIEI